MAGTATLAKKQTKSKKKGRNKMTLALLSMMLPGFIYLLINNYIPMAGLVIAFKRFNYSKGIWGSDWCGFSNFTYLFRTNDALNIVRNTLGYNLTFILLGNLLAVTVAVMLNFLRGNMNKKVYQTLILILSDFHGGSILYRIWFFEPGQRISEQPVCENGRGKDKLVYGNKILAFHSGYCKPLEGLWV